MPQARSDYVDFDVYARSQQCRLISARIYVASRM